MKTAQVNMYCKLYTDVFPPFYHGECAAGYQIMEFLLDDCGHAFGSAGQILKGDLNLWYLATNEKVGVLSINGEERSWKWGGSSWMNVLWFVVKLRKLGVFSKEQAKTLAEKIDEGKQNFNFMYDISKYLEAKEDGTPWKHPGDKDRKESVLFFHNVINTLKDGGLICQD
jgi:hypothetical protein